MAPPRTSLRNFLAGAKSALRQAIQGSRKVTFVVGNESADLDSLASSILFAYIRTFAPPAQSQSEAFSDIYVPLTNIPSTDLRLRPEFLALLPCADLEPGHLITLDDLLASDGHEEQLQPKDTQWILVDHNNFIGKLGSLYRDRVRGVIDHHEDEGVIPMDDSIQPRIVEAAGSCTSLVTNYLRESWDQLPTLSTSGSAQDESAQEVSVVNASARIWDAQLAQFTLAAVLVDTARLKSEYKTTDHDRSAVEYLERKIASHPDYDRGAFYRTINNAKKDIDHLNMEDLLRRDYKQWTENDSFRLGISSVPRSLTWQVEHAKIRMAEAEEEEEEEEEEGKIAKAFVDAVHRHARSCHLSICVIMASSKSARGELQRELLIWVLDPECNAAMQRFAEIGQNELGLVDWHEKDLPIAKGTEYARVWWQRDVSKSRKQVAPLLRRCINKAE